MKVLIATEVIHPGGAETFLLRLAQALYKKGHEVIIFNFHKDIYNKELHRKTAPDVTVVCAENPFRKLTKFWDSFFLKLQIDSSIRNYFIKKSFRSLINNFQPQIIHSHLFKTDVICAQLNEEKNIPVVATMHGDYTMYYNNVQEGKNIRIPGFTKKLLHVLSRLSCIVCISQEQELFFKNKMQVLTDKPLHLAKIYNGYEANTNALSTVTRKAVGIPQKAFVFGMVARGIPSKGWEELIEAFNKGFESENAYLLLVGGSDYIDELKRKHANNDRIIFTGTVTNPIDWINLFDVGLLPSYFGSESLPTVIMEYLYCHKPVIATSIGEIPFMIRQEGQTAGLLINITKGKVDCEELREAMVQVYSDKELYNRFKKATSKCFEQFDMERCVALYERIYNQYAL